MLPKISYTQTKAFKALESYHKSHANINMAELFDKNPQRFNQFSLEIEDLLFDFSKNLINQDILDLLLEMAKECQLEKAIQAMYSGEKINETEGRSVMHIALRNLSDKPYYVDGKNIMPQIHKALDKIKTFSDKIQNQTWLGCTGKPITDIVNIGIGGSDLGPVMVTEALKNYAHPLIKTHFVSNIDGTNLFEVLKQVNKETTLFLIASKTFTTQETMTNAESAKSWFVEDNVNKDKIDRHFVAISTNVLGATDFGVHPDNIFTFWDWVGGRYSLWSSIGLSIACSIGYEHFKELLRGAFLVDTHFEAKPLGQNIPVIMGLLGVYYGHFYKATTHAILPYDQYLHRFPAYLQQADMESNGKSVDRHGQSTQYQTGPIVWGEPGTNGQHAFYQLIHQGTHVIPCDFIAPANSQHDMGEHHKILLSNFFAQTEALMKGKNIAKVVTELIENGLSEEEIQKLAPFKVFKGNQPTNSFLLKKLTPKALGQLIALYEHKIFVQGILWNIFSFDQWGVELGKVLAKDIYKELQDEASIDTHDTSTNNLINRFKKWYD